MTALVLAAGHDTHGKRDSSAVFVPEAKAFCKLHGFDPPKFFDNRLLMKRRKNQVLSLIASAERQPVSTVAMFCHGYPTGLQIGFKLADIPELADALANIIAPYARITLYCCDTARDADDDSADDVLPGPGGTGGVADSLRNELLRLGVPAFVYGHATAGHATHNPHVRVFNPGELGGGHWLIAPKSPLWSRWRRALRETSLRFRFPYMAAAEIEEELRGAVA